MARAKWSVLDSLPKATWESALDTYRQVPAMMTPEDAAEIREGIAAGLTLYPVWGTTLPRILETYVENTALRIEVARLHAALEKIAASNDSDEPTCEFLRIVARDTLRAATDAARAR